MATRWDTVEYYSARLGMVYKHIHATTWMNFKNIHASERSQTQKATFSMSPFIQHSEKTKLRQWQKSGQSLPGFMAGGLTAKEQEGTFGRDEILSILIVGEIIHYIVMCKLIT